MSAILFFLRTGYNAIVKTMLAVLFAAALPAACSAAQPSLNGRIETVSESLLGRPYRLGPLGEGPAGEFDAEPLSDLKEFDCTTFVEHVMALALEPDPRKALDVTLQKIRYKDGVVSYETRNHFTELDWVPNNVVAGFLKDITFEVAPDQAKTATKTISKRRWYETRTLDDIQGFPNASLADRTARLSRLQALSSRFEDQVAGIPYVPIEVLPALFDKIPSGTIANLVRADMPDKGTMISHQFLFIRKGGLTYVRQASSLDHRVEDVLATDYLAHYAGSSWRVLGVDLNALTAPGR